jgi:pSer/pThr/pTyr-binding forkhead associated (FHA) protein
MSAPIVRLHATFSDHRVRDFAYERPRMCIVGPAHDCDIRIPGEDGHEVSCYHCLLVIDPPRIRVRDLFSRSGTFVNGERIAQRPDDLDPDEMPGTDLKHGDELRIGTTVFQVIVEPAEVFEPAHCH